MDDIFNLIIDIIYCTYKGSYMYNISLYMHIYSISSMTNCSFLDACNHTDDMENLL